MAQPVVVRTYSNKRRKPTCAPRAVSVAAVPTLPAVSSYAFADILRSADSAELQEAIDGIAEICAKNRMSLADEYASHLPPLGEITESTSSKLRPHLHRPGMRRALTSVPEASSGSSEGSRKGKSRTSIFGFRGRNTHKIERPRQICIGLNRTISIGFATTLATELPPASNSSSGSIRGEMSAGPIRQLRSDQRASSAAVSSLQRLLSVDRGGQSG